VTSGAQQPSWGRRRAGAPRLLDWTGERFVPWTPDVQVAYEHLQRFAWAAPLVAGQRVLDLGSGEGFGSAVLASTAASVVGVDVDERAVEHATLNHGRPGLEFRAGSALDLAFLGDERFDAVVAFEVVEHVAEPEALLEQARAVLAPGGLLVLSTPDRRTYRKGGEAPDPYHERELSEAELRDLLGARFGNVALWGQRTLAGARLAALDAAGDPEPAIAFVERTGESWAPAEEPAPVYLVALASDAALPSPPRESLLADATLELVAAEQRRATTLAARLAALEAEVGRLESQVHTLEGLRAETRRELDAARRQLEYAERVHQQRLAFEEGNRDRELTGALARADELAHRLARVEQSTSWRALEKARGALGQDTVRARGARRLLAVAGRRVPRPPAVPPPDPADAPLHVRIAPVDEPVVSIVMPVHGGAELTAGALWTIAHDPDPPPFEVIVVDDHADEETRWLLQRCEGLQVVRNEENLGFLRSTNAGVANARGRYVVLLNNDVEVRPGWLSALVRRAECSPDVGAVGAKLVYPDGRLQEAGAITWRDGDCWNYGRGHDPQHPSFTYVREVDYCSGACLLVRRDLWERIGGFDERFAPAYYEDTDLCFAVREEGFRVLYEPAAEVVHLEGGSSGTDVGSGVKRHQELNRPKFFEKWRDRLEAEHLPNDPALVRLASDRRHGPEVLIADHRVPTPDQDSGSLRMSHVVDQLLSLGCRVTFVPDNFARIEPYTYRLQEKGVRVLHGPVDLNEELAVLGPELVLAILSRPVVAPRYVAALRTFAPQALLAYDTVDLHFVRETRHAEVERESDGDTAAALAARARAFRELELSLVRSCDVSLVVTGAERAELEAEVPGARVVVLPNAHEVGGPADGPDGRAGLLFVGSFEHEPNADAVRWLVERVMPMVWREEPGLCVTVVGTKPPPAVSRLASPRVRIAGWVEDLEPLLAEARASVAPLRYGAGMKGKVTQALSVGLPVVTTTIGAEGLGLVDGEHALVADDPGGFAQRILKVVRDDALWRVLSEAGRDVVRRTASDVVLRERLEELLAMEHDRADAAPLSPAPGAEPAAAAT
jgi:O-antigen biosynthesis protein